VALALLLDRCADSNLLPGLLAAAGHAVTRSAAVGGDRAPDTAFFAHALAHALVIVTKDPADFRALFDAAEEGKRPGVLAVYLDNDVTGDMTDDWIVRAVANVEAVYADFGGPHGHFVDLTKFQY
jgi:predicted nuclease of predicted toxin-antitoxin system